VEQAESPADPPPERRAIADARCNSRNACGTTERKTLHQFPRPRAFIRWAHPPWDCISRDPSPLSYSSIDEKTAMRVKSWRFLGGEEHMGTILQPFRIRVASVPWSSVAAGQTKGTEVARERQR
jgi:hypothetical protein